MVEILSLLKEIPKFKSDAEQDIRDMSELEGDEFAEQPEEGLKILTPDQMLSRLPVI